MINDVTGRETLQKTLDIIFRNFPKDGDGDEPNIVKKKLEFEER